MPLLFVDSVRSSETMLSIRSSLSAVSIEPDPAARFATIAVYVLKEATATVNNAKSTIVGSAPRVNISNTLGA